MKADDVPQDENRSFDGQRKPLYVLGDDGSYTTKLSSGWYAEEVVLDQAIQQFQSKAEAARRRVTLGESVPLEFHMYRRRMDLTVLAQSTGLFRWQVRRHLKPHIFARLPDKKLRRYADALGMTIADIKAMPAAHDD